MYKNRLGQEYSEWDLPIPTETGKVIYDPTIPDWTKPAGSGFDWTTAKDWLAVASGAAANIIRATKGVPQMKPATGGLMSTYAGRFPTGAGGASTWLLAGAVGLGAILLLGGGRRRRR